ncbi:glycosyltransferase family 1 protein [Hypholoma sublateritium FD-334 SS-4]|uniref:Glycosyltransferase family 1 protein n=1 Tax=Hypholoma sublateritium (strain FD-334 SS-4) TaxID=945553 RepID=A0A0D2P8H5_HYPSF|nr:glycosyltransferase family 1 protein [Hypholoma sublateritium FD-334 SS-4]
MATADSTHFLLVAPPSWGHVRPTCQLALRLLDCDANIVATVLVPPIMMAKSQAEVATHVGSTAPSSRIRVLTMFELDDPNPFKHMQPFVETFSAAYKTLRDGKVITCAATKIAYDPVSAPVAVVIDSFLAPVMFATRALTGSSVPIVCFATGSVLSIMRIHTPETLGGLGDFTARVAAEAERSGETQDVAGGKLYRRTTGAIVQVPGLPSMYDHEFFPQDTSVANVVTGLLKSAQAFFEQGDAVLLSSSYVLEREAIDAMKVWLSETKKDVYGVGPLLPANYWGVHTDGGATAVQVFLDAMLETHGRKSVVLISFGSFFWPAVQDYVDETILALIEKGIPFILCHPSSRAVISSELAEKITSSGLGVLSSWIPQHYVLTHPATGWFLTHGGQGGVTEALASGIPLICWPIEGDQVVTSVHASVNLGVGFELIEVRSGDGLKPIHRLGGRAPKGTRAAMAAEIREVLDSARGEAGAQMRTRAEEMRNELKNSWVEGGIARTELQAFVAKFK